MFYCFKSCAWFIAVLETVKNESSSAHYFRFVCRQTNIIFSVTNTVRGDRKSRQGEVFPSVELDRSRGGDGARRSMVSGEPKRSAHVLHGSGHE